MSALLATLARLQPEACFVQIGGGECLREVIVRSRWQGVVVEPIPAKADELERIYGPLGRVIVERAAIGSADGEQSFHYDPRPGGPGALRREVLYFPENFHPGLDDSLVDTVTPTLTIETLVGRHELAAIDVLRIDTAGDEAEILGQVERASLRPTLIAYDHGLLGAGVRRAAVERLRALGYEVLEDGRETWCLCIAGLPAAQATALRTVWRAVALRRRVDRARSNGATPTFAFPVTYDEQRYLEKHYDARTPLPPDAADRLADDNPRLTQLRREYAALDVAATQHHLWSSERVDEHVDLRYFRGDNLYVWHRPEHPRAMALKLVLYMRYLQEQRAQELLDLLDEDGAFGCWTTDVTGYGKVSRDLLDSVNEILFLDRQLGVRSKELRVLDVGAGYGRLAHRMSAAVPGLVDYCCVDAVPESTFLAEYYLAFRGCTPPARVVPLPEVPQLETGAFDLAVNVHSFSECTLDAIRWWAEQLERLEVPYLFVVPNEADGILSREPDGSYHSALPVLEAAGYEQVAKRRAIDDRAVRDALMLGDNFYLFERRR